MLRSLFLLLTLLLSLFSTDLAAIEVKDLYQASVDVDSQAPEKRTQAIKRALSGVFLKIGGKQNVLDDKVLKQAQKNASRYVSQYRYQLNDEQLSLIVRFNEDKVNQLFKKANLALWGSLRPQVLLWLIDEQGNTRQIVSDASVDSVERTNDDGEVNFSTVINTFSEQRGLPIIMPLMDLTDSEQVIISDFWDFYPEQINQASLRYFADTVVVMRVSNSTLLSLDEQALVVKEAESSQNIDCGLLCEQEAIELPKVLDWRVYSQGTIYFKEYHGLNKMDLITEGLSDITELIYQSYALLDSASNDFVIEVKNVTSLDNDIQLFDFLSDLSAVNNVTLISAQADVRQFKLDLIGAKSSFLASLKLNNKLTQVIEPQITVEPLDEEVVGEQLNNQQDSDLPPIEDNLNSSMTITEIEETAAKESSSVEQSSEESSIDNSKFENELADITDGKKNYLEMNIPVVNLTPKTESELAEAAKNESVNQNVEIKEIVKEGSEATNKVEQVDGTEEIKPQLAIAPSIPVFYWEQG